MADGATVKNLTVKDGGTVTLYARWKRDTYKVKFYANDGTARTKSQTIDRGLATKLNANPFKNAGFKFAGWANSATGNVVYKNKEAVMDLAKKGKTKKLYAVWVPKNKWVFSTYSGKGMIGAVEMTVTLTVASSGKISGKFVRKSKKKSSYTFEADGFDVFENDTYCAMTTMKFGPKKVLDLKIEVGRTGKPAGGKEVFSKITVMSADGSVIGWGFKK